MSAIDVILIVLFVGLIVFDALVARRLNKILVELVFIDSKADSRCSLSYHKVDFENILIMRDMLKEIRDKLDEKAVDVGGALQNQDVLIFENKVVRDILSEVKRCNDEGLPLDEDLRAAIDKVVTINKD